MELRGVLQGAGVGLLQVLDFVAAWFCMGAQDQGRVHAALMAAVAGGGDSTAAVRELAQQVLLRPGSAAQP